MIVSYQEKEALRINKPCNYNYKLAKVTASDIFRMKGYFPNLNGVCTTTLIYFSAFDFCENVLFSSKLTSGLYQACTKIRSV